MPLLLAEPAIEYVAWWRHSRYARPIYQRPAIALEALKMRIFEPQAWSQATLVGVIAGLGISWVMASLWIALLTRRALRLLRSSDTAS